MSQIRIELHGWSGLNWYDYGFRWYMPELGRFTGVDPISDQFAHVSVYNYAENEPVGHIDLWGLQKAISVIQMGKNSQGKWYTNSAFTMERGDMRWGTYSANADLGSRGRLFVIDNLESGDRLSVYKQTIMDRVMNRFDDGGPETEVGGGIMFFKTDGMGKETRFSPNADIGENIDDLLGAFEMTKNTDASIKSIEDAIDWGLDLGQVVGEQIYGGNPQKTKASNQPVKPTCLSCGGDPHGLDYVRTNSDGTTDTIRTVKKEH